MKTTFLKTASLAAMLCTANYAAAETPAAPAPDMMQASADSDFAQFVPKTDTVGTQIDYKAWDEALEYFVYPMGKSIREGAPSVEPGIGTRRVYGHDSLYRLEGNRVTFSYLTDEIIASLTEYREDLERTADLVDISKLAKNEQLAFWLNLHNVAVIEQIALAYPVSQPSRIKMGDSDLPLDETPFITVKGVKMSPKDIRTKIVYPNWKNPKVMYGFFRGEIGGPSIQKNAFQASNVGELLDRSANEFVNSLRGTQKRGDTMTVSEIYAEGRPFFFLDWPGDIRAHIEKYANEDVKEIIDETSDVRADIYERDIADLTKGERDPEYAYVERSADERIGIPAAIRRLLREQDQKYRKIIRREGPVGRVTVIDIGDITEPKEPEKVE